MVRRVSSKPYGYSTRYNCLILFCVILGCIFLVFLAINTNEVSEVLLSEENSVEAALEGSVDVHQRCTIHTGGCCIPKLHPFDESIKKFVNVPSSVKTCSPSNTLPLLFNNATHIWVAAESFYYYNVTDDAKFSCCYRGFHRPEFVENIRSKDIDNRVTYGPCIDFHSVVEVSHEFVNVVCSSRQVNIYEDYFAFAQLKDFSGDEVPPLNSTDAFSVIVMGVDAVSRMNFHRTMPRTLKYLMKKEAIELLGFNKVGDNTFPNLVPLLMGLREEDLKTTCLPKKSSTFDNCPLVWDWYKEAGYVTAFAEDTAALSAFNHFRIGFGNSPTDYYLYTFMHEAETHIGHNKDLYSYLCMGNRYFYQVFLNYVLDLVNTLKSVAIFGFFWEVSMSHDYLNYPMLMDHSYEQFFRSMDELGHLDRTVFVLLSDHGMRWGDIRQTKQGRLEERLPLAYILVPPKFRDMYRLAYDNLQANSRRLTTPFDLHRTLLDLKDLSSIKDERIAFRSRDSYSLKGDRGISLFLSVPLNRTCEDAGIDEHWCACHRSRNLEPADSTIVEGAAFLVDWLNALLEHHRECTPLKLISVVEASEVELSLREVREGWRTITVVVRVSPSDAIFEATLRLADPGGWTLAGPVSRLNLYGRQSACVDDYTLHLYCYCR